MRLRPPAGRGRVGFAGAPVMGVALLIGLASPSIALWNRVQAFAPAQLDRAFATHALVRATLMRVTLHAVTADDHPVSQAAMQTTIRPPDCTTSASRARA